MFRDRYFLDRVVTRVIELEEADHSYPGNYTAYSRIRERLARQQNRAAASAGGSEIHPPLRRETGRLWPEPGEGVGAHSVGATARKKRCTWISPRACAVAPRWSPSSGSRRVDGKQLFSGLELVVRRGERVGIVGPNGSGKTTLLNPDGPGPRRCGHFAFGHNVGRVSAGLERRNQNTLLEEILDAGAATIEEARSLLARFLFFGDDVFKRVGDLSGGETTAWRSRLLLSHDVCSWMSR